MHLRYFIFIYLWKRWWYFHFNKTESSSPQNALCQFWLKLDLCFWISRWKMWKVYGSDDKDDDGQRTKLTKAYCFLWTNLNFRPLRDICTKGSVLLRAGEKIRKFENQNVDHCLVLMCSSVITFSLLYEKIPMFKIEYISSFSLSCRVGIYSDLKEYS